MRVHLPRHRMIAASLMRHYGSLPLFSSAMTIIAVLSATGNDHGCTAIGSCFLLALLMRCCFGYVPFGVQICGFLRYFNFYFKILIASHLDIADSARRAPWPNYSPASRTFFSVGLKAIGEDDQAIHLSRGRVSSRLRPHQTELLSQCV
ncbi:hypothetical protein B0H16DRAFT_1597893 [Mycena metata]|uniref:Uncharacterized protein n=1 Tax=Mycena metata TaxID=1033252 RepID=A0AAD7MN78_9AGAR|nr:hypothetical protein B0H16DRAFT_1597893 [Mycena metata]